MPSKKSALATEEIKPRERKPKKVSEAKIRAAVKFAMDRAFEVIDGQEDCKGVRARLNECNQTFYNLGAAWVDALQQFYRYLEKTCGRGGRVCLECRLHQVCLGEACDPECQAYVAADPGGSV